MSEEDPDASRAILFRGTGAHVDGRGEPHPGAYPWLCHFRGSFPPTLSFPKATQIKPLRVFNRLATARFTEEDITSMVAICQQFHSQAGGDYLGHDFASGRGYGPCH